MTRRWCRRRDITQQRPALPAQAGKAFAVLGRVVETGQLQPAGPPTRSNGVLVFGLVTPEIEVEALAHALVSIAKEWERNRPSADHYDRTGAVEDDLAS